MSKKTASIRMTPPSLGPRPGPAVLQLDRLPRAQPTDVGAGTLRLTAELSIDEAEPDVVEQSVVHRVCASRRYLAQVRVHVEGLHPRCVGRQAQGRQLDAGDGERVTGVE